MNNFCDKYFIRSISGITLVFGKYNHGTIHTNPYNYKLLVPRLAYPANHKLCFLTSLKFLIEVIEDGWPLIAFRVGRWPPTFILSTQPPFKDLYKWMEVNFYTIFFVAKYPFLVAYWYKKDVLRVLKLKLVQYSLLA